MANEIIIEESDFYKLATELDNQRVEMRKLRQEVEQLRIAFSQASSPPGASTTPGKGEVGRGA